MAFTDLDFLFVFLPLSWMVHAVAGRGRNFWLAAASAAFYAFGGGAFTLVIGLSIVGNYALARAISRNQADSTRHAWLAIGIAANLATLAWFKYADFLVANLNSVLGLLHVPLLMAPAVALPIGLSFFTFHAISYLVDISRGQAVAQKRPVETALYLLLFPQLVAGPIVRYRDIAHQITKRHITLEGAASGLRRFIVGLGKKLLIANALAGPVDTIFALTPTEISPGLAWLAVVCYTLQIYFDFSGYSDMAVGLGQLFGFTLPENFRYPYAATSVQDFWRRWHITLSSWFRDYLYLPMGGNRHGTVREYRNLVLVFALCGLWHGASWTFVVWGLFHGLFLVVERLVPHERVPRWPWRPARHGYVLAVVMIGWVLFRADTLGQAAAILMALGGRAAHEPTPLLPSALLSTPVIVALIVGAVGSTPLIPIAQELWHGLGSSTNRSPTQAPSAAFATLRALWMVALLCLSLAYAAAGTYNPFIYFRF